MDATRPPRCRRCGRPLKTPESIAAGIGPVCARKEKAADVEARQPKPKPTPKARKRRERGEVVTDPRQLSFPF